MRTRSISSHAVLGDGRSAALVADDGMVDWLCWPDFDSPAVFAAILDEERGGGLRVGPADAARPAARRYLDHTHVLETRWATAGGALRVTDWMALLPERGRGYAPGHELLRLATCDEGEVEVEIAADLRPGFGARGARVRPAGPLGLRLERPGELYTLRATVALAAGADGVVRGRARLRAGQELQVSLAHDVEAPAALPPLGPRVHSELRRAVTTWRRWAAKIPEDVPYREAVVRSALVLKLLAFAPSGAIIAAPTTSLPERPGGDLNWDYRYCWPRDASLTVSALQALGCDEEAVRFTAWLLHATSLTRPRIRVLYDVYGRSPPPERELPHLAGHGGARPVRIGNAAAGQHQLDTYGEVVDAVARIARPGAMLDRETRGLLRDLGRFVCRHWQEPDSGLWEPREPPRHRTHSLVLAWTALDRLLALHAAGALPGLPAGDVEAHRREIRTRVERDGWNERLQSYASELGGDRVDAALLLLPWYGFADAGSPRMRATWRRIRERLGAGPGLLYRYEPSRAAGEGAFGACSFWEAAYLARGGGSLADACGTFEDAHAHANDLGLFAEQIDPETGAALGNFPQAFTHVGLLDAAVSIGRRARAEAAAGAARAAPEGEVRA